MKLLWFTWKDLTHPQAGGAEVVNEELAKRMVANGHEVIMLVGGYPGMVKREIITGYTVIRCGNRYSVYWQVWRYYRQNLRGWADLVIDEVNTMPFFAKFYVREPNILFVHMLARRIWFYQIFLPLSLIGYLAEPFYLWLLHDRRVITISQSTKKDLLKYGFIDENIGIISEGIQLKPVKSLSAIKKFDRPTVLSLGAIRPMKQTLHQLWAFERAKQEVPDLQLKIAGRPHGWYGRYFLWRLRRSPYRADIEYLGRVSEAEKVELMQRSHLIMVTSVKEGWGLIVTEAASQGTPAVVYDVDGLRDSVQDGVSGAVVRRQPAALARGLHELIKDKRKYSTMRLAAWQHSKKVTFEASYDGFRRFSHKTTASNPITRNPNANVD